MLRRGALGVRLRPGHHRLRAAESRALPGQTIRPNESRRDLGSVALVELVHERAVEYLLEL